MRYLKIILSLFLLISLSQIALARDNSEYYQAKDGKVDSATFIGWTTYHSVCVSCHGVGAVGNETSPDLTEVADKLSPEQFRMKVMHRTIVKFTADDWMSMEENMFKEIAKQERRDLGELETMPRWKHNPNVTNNVSNIYRYLKARADNAIGTDKPGLLK